MVGLFIVTMGIALLAAIGAIIQRMLGVDELLAAEGGIERTSTEGEMLRELLSRVPKLCGLD